MNTHEIDSDEVLKFFRNIKAERIGALQRALGEGMPASIKNGNYQSALTVAAEVGFLEGARALIAAGANVNQRDLTSFMNKGGQPDRKITTALLTAVRAKNIDMIELLLDAGADPRIDNETGQTAARWLLKSGMLSTGSKASAAAGTPAPPLNEATFKRSLAALDKLMTPEVVHKVDKRGEGLLHDALAYYVDLHPDAFDMVLSQGMDLEAMAGGTRPIHREWEEEDFPMLRKLVAHGADINARDWRGASVLFYIKEADAVDEILELGGNLNHLDDIGRNALAASCDESANIEMPTEVAVRLITAGIDTEHKDLSGASVESLLADYARTDTEKLLPLIQARKARDVLHSASRAAAARPR